MTTVINVTEENTVNYGRNYNETQLNLQEIRKSFLKIIRIRADDHYTKLNQKV